MGLAITGRGGEYKGTDQDEGPKVNRGWNHDLFLWVESRSELDFIQSRLIM